MFISWMMSELWKDASDASVHFAVGCIFHPSSSSEDSTCSPFLACFVFPGLLAFHSGWCELQLLVVFSSHIVDD